MHLSSPILFIDGYKFDHRRQYPPGTTKVYSNWTPRESRVAGTDKVVFFGLQAFLQRVLVEEFKWNFFHRNVDDICDYYQRRMDGYLGPNNIGTDHIRALHGLGYIPLEFRALPEGTRVPLRVPMFTVENTHPDFYWVPNYLETLISASLWQACTSATNAYRMRRMLGRWARETGGDEAFVQWQGHDFSMRGMGSVEAAAMSGMGHLLNFRGTDTLPAIDWVEAYYAPRDPNHFIAGSVPATEHSVMCAGGELGERETFDRILGLYPKGIVSVVSDTWDLWHVLTDIVPSLKDKVLARDGKLVIRPDSGNPVDIICGDPLAPEDSPARKGVVELLWDTFGGMKSDHGYRQLDPHIGCIYGDSITVERATEICARLEQKDFASTNVVLGVGSYTYQYVTRDTFGFAMKATHCTVAGEGRAIFKKPKTGDGMKNSAKGRLAVLKDYTDQLQLVNEATPEQEENSRLRLVWRDGEFVQRWGFDEIRERLWPGAW